jgi:putative ABC transport system permease protein
MLAYYFTIALRSFRRHRIFSLINLLGLALGMAAALLIFLYVRFERSYDGFHSKKDRIYRVVTDDQTPTELRKESHTAAGIGPIIKSDLPGVEDYVRIWPVTRGISVGTTKLQEEHSVYADASFLTMFDFPLLKGDPKTALIHPNTAVLSETAARKYFGAVDPMGKSMLLTDAKVLLTVTGVMKDIPGNSHIQADVVVSMPTLLEPSPDYLQLWGMLVCYTYVSLKPGASAQHLQAQFPGLMKKYVGKAMERSKELFSLSLEPLQDVYLHSPREAPVKGRALNVTVLSIIAGFILLIAGINFVNLTTARAVERAREVGVRKVMGSARGQLMLQFLTESVLQCLFAGVLAFMLASVCLPLFNTLAGKVVSDGLLQNRQAAAWLFTAALVTGIAAGFYPALVLSGSRPVSMLKEHYSGSRNGVFLRQLLVVVQFTLSIVLIAGTVIVYSQLHFMRSQRLGFDKEQELVINYHHDERAGVFRDELAKIPHVLSTTFSSYVPGQRPDINSTEIENARGQMQEASIPALRVEFNFVKHYKLEIVAGRDFDPGLPTDSSNALLINEAAAAAFGYTSPADAVGKRYSQHGDGRIIGVVKNFHIRGLEEAIEPMTLRAGPYWQMEMMTVKIATADVPATMDAIRKAWDRALPEKPLSYYFLDEAFNNLYRGEMQFGRLALCFAVLAILISCLGLFGLAAYSTVQRRREMAIRKVLGADVRTIFRLLSGGFLKPVCLALLIGTPMAWMAMHAWLEHFAYRTSIGWWVFGLTGGIAIVITLATVTYHVVQAALANPVDDLREE